MRSGCRLMSRRTERTKRPRGFSHESFRFPRSTYKPQQVCRSPCSQVLCRRRFQDSAEHDEVPLDVEEQLLPARHWECCCCSAIGTPRRGGATPGTSYELPFLQKLRVRLVPTGFHSFVPLKLGREATGCGRRNRIGRLQFLKKTPCLSR